MLKYADEQMDFGHWDGRPVVGIVQFLPYQDCGRNITNNLRWWMCIYSNFDITYINIVGLSLYVINRHCTDMASTVSLYKTACTDN